MQITEYAASRAGRAGDIVLTEDVGASLRRGDVLNVTERSGLEVLRIASVKLGDVPSPVLMQYVQPVRKNHWRPHCCDMEFNSVFCAALAQIKHDAEEAVSIDDITAADVLETRVTLLRIKKVARYECERS